MQIATEPGGAIVTWESRRPYQSRLLVAHGKPLQKSASAERVRKHRVVLRDLEVGANLLQVLYPDETKSLTKKFVIEKFECQLTQGNPFTLRCPAAQVAEMKILYGEKARVIECQRLGEDAWTATLPTKSIFNENPTVVVRYGAGHSHRFKWLDIAQDAANDLIAKLSKKKAQQYVDLVNKEEDAQITRAIEKAKEATKGSCSVLNIFRSKESEGARLGTPRADITDVIHSIDGQLELQKIDDITWAEVDLDCSAFDSFVILLTVNDANNYILFDNPIFGDRHYSKIRLYQRIPPSDLKIGTNKFLFRARLLFEDRSSRDTKMRQIDLRLGRE